MANGPIGTARYKISHAHWLDNLSIMPAVSTGAELKFQHSAARAVNHPREAKANLSRAMSLSLEELCAMVNVSFEEVKNLHMNGDRRSSGRLQDSPGSAEHLPEDFSPREHLCTPEHLNRCILEAGVGGSVSEEDDTHHAKRKKGPENWKRNIQKRRRMEGKSYSGKQKDVGEVTRAARIMGPGCASDACRKSAKRFCHTFSEEDRQNIFQNFWQRMNWEERRSYVAELVDHTPVARKRSASQDSRRLSTLSYHLILDGEKKRVCKKLFLATLGLGEWSVAHWVQVNELEKNSSETVVGEEALASLQAFLRNLPKLSPHFVQPSSSKVHLEPMFQSMSDLHRVYQRYCEEQLHTTPLSRKVLMDEFNQLNLALYRPEEDACSSEERQIDCWIKEEVCEEKAGEALDREKLILSCMDLQAMILCSELNTSSLYYKTKLAVHNLALYHTANHGSARSVWAEGEGGQTVNKFTSRITDCFQQQEQNDDDE
ncbi:hypothetical protein AMEX_G21877 [Astyanax mexicanus]|uniref:Uncharacterized protein n=1 Tax=Astyanax mexicanus TaxID=7994 RepID=A0A8T2L1E7_ASTMX|nr:hypothetical protein AMEX_G21877 [Astyanax mexicanus]